LYFTERLPKNAKGELIWSDANTQSRNMDLYKEKESYIQEIYVKYFGVFRENREE
jgi:hypothetical protein